jgi:DNA-binding transcriptional MerR regulator
MTVLLSIGDFSRMTHLSVKALRHYHDVGLLEPAEVDRSSGYRFYEASQVPVAQVIRRFRDLGMPVDEVKAVLTAPDVTTRNQVIVAHLERMEEQLAHTQATVASLRAVLEGPRVQAPVEYRSVPPTTTLAIREMTTAADMESSWWTDAFITLRKAIEETGVSRAGPDGCLYSNEMFELEEGEMVAFVPVTGHAVGLGRVQVYELPAVELAIMVHEGTYDELDRTYGALGTYVAERALGVDGPIRELYVVSPLDVEDVGALRTEVGWPVFRAG